MYIYTYIYVVQILEMLNGGLACIPMYMYIHTYIYIYIHT